jgi:excisionase family DNA binding protein
MSTTGTTRSTPPSNRHQWMTLAEIADELQVPLNTVYRWSSARLFRSVRVGRHVRVRRDWFEEWVDAKAR